MGIYLIIGVFFSFNGTKTSVIGGWSTLRALYRRAIFKPYFNHYQNWKEKFVRVIGRDDTPMVTTETNDALGFPLAWIDNLGAINGFEFNYLTFDE